MNRDELEDNQLLKRIKKQCTPRQIQACELYADGYGIRRVSRIMGISPAAVRSLLDAVERNLGKEAA